MADITISKDETLEIDAIIEQSSRVDSVIGVDDRTDYNIDGFQTHTGVFNPQGTGEYNIKVNGQTLTVQVNEANSIPGSTILNAKASDHDGSKWVSNIGPDIPDAGGSPSKTSVTANSTTYDVMRYDASNGDYSQTSNISISSGNSQAVIYTARLRSIADDFDHWIDGGDNQEFEHIVSTSGNDEHRVLSGSNDLKPATVFVDTNWHTYCVEGVDSSSKLRLLEDGSVLDGYENTNGFDVLSGLTLAARANGDREGNIDLAEVTVLENQSTTERDDEINRQKSTYGIA